MSSRTVYGCTRVALPFHLPSCVATSSFSLSLQSLIWAVWPATRRNADVSSLTGPVGYSSLASAAARCRGGFYPAFTGRRLHSWEYLHIGACSTSGSSPLRSGGHDCHLRSATAAAQGVGTHVMPSSRIFRISWREARECRTGLGASARARLTGSEHTAAARICHWPPSLHAAIHCPRATLQHSMRSIPQVLAGMHHGFCSSSKLPGRHTQDPEQWHHKPNATNSMQEARTLWDDFEGTAGSLQHNLAGRRRVLLEMPEGGGSSRQNHHQGGRASQWSAQHFGDEAPSRRDQLFSHKSATQAGSAQSQKYAGPAQKEKGRLPSARLQQPWPPDRQLQVDQYPAMNRPTSHPTSYARNKTQLSGSAAAPGHAQRLNPSREELDAMAARMAGGVPDDMMSGADQEEGGGGRSRLQRGEGRIVSGRASGPEAVRAAWDTNYPARTDKQNSRKSPDSQRAQQARLRGNSMIAREQLASARRNTRDSRSQSLHPKPLVVPSSAADRGLEDEDEDADDEPELSPEEKERLTRKVLDELQADKDKPAGSVTVAKFFPTPSTPPPHADQSAFFTVMQAQQQAAQNSSDKCPATHSVPKLDRNKLDWFIGFVESQPSFYLQEDGTPYFQLYQLDHDNRVLQKIHDLLGFASAKPATLTITHPKQLHALIHLFNGNLILVNNRQRFIPWAQAFTACHPHLPMPELRSDCVWKPTKRNGWLSGIIDGDLGHFDVQDEFVDTNAMFLKNRGRFSVSTTDLQLAAVVSRLFKDAVVVKKGDTYTVRIEGYEKDFVQVVRYFRSMPLQSFKQLSYKRWERMVLYPIATAAQMANFLRSPKRRAKKLLVNAKRVASLRHGEEMRYQRLELVKQGKHDEAMALRESKEAKRTVRVDERHYQLLTVGGMTEQKGIHYIVVPANSQQADDEAEMDLDAGDADDTDDPPLPPEEGDDETIVEDEVLFDGLVYGEVDDGDDNELEGGVRYDPDLTDNDMYQDAKWRQKVEKKRRAKRFG